MEKLKMRTPDFTDENIARIAELFPSCVTESRDENGVLKRAIDFDQLKQELSGSIVDGPAERYQLNWPGKREALLTANAPIAKTLRPCREESLDFDTTRHLFIEGDNLDALKLLQETYLGKVKMIYIDPPYNTGNDFIYDDDFVEDKDKYFKRSMQIDKEGNQLVMNPDSNGRFHSDWLSMILPRLKLARTLLADDGVLFVSIDENELNNLELACKEVFGAGNVLGNFPVIMNLKGNQDAFPFAETHEYFVMCAKSKSSCSINNFKVNEEELLKDWLTDEYGLYKVADNLRATGVNAPREKRPNLWYPIFLNLRTLNFYVTEDDCPIDSGDQRIMPTNPDGEELSWYWSKATFNQSKHNLILKNTSNGWQFYRKQRPQLGDLPTKKPKSFFYKPDYSTSTATTKLKELMGGKVFDGPKPVPFLVDLAQIATAPSSLVVDFFSGSATTAHAVMALNAGDGGTRRYILIQLQEEIDEGSEAYKAGYKTIGEIGKERIRRAGKMIREDAGLDGANLDIGFRVLKIATSSMKDVYYSPDDQAQANLLDQIANVKEDRTSEDLLFQVLLDWGVDLALPITLEKIQGKEVFLVDENALAACFDVGLNEDFVKELAQRNPLRAVFRDAGFASDDVKINVEQIFKLMSPETEVRSI